MLNMANNTKHKSWIMCWDNMSTSVLTIYKLNKCYCTCRLPRKFPAVMSFNDSCHEGVLQFFSGSTFTGLTFLWKSSSTQSMIRMMRWGGRPSVRTVAISDGLIVYVGKEDKQRAGEFRTVIYCMAWPRWESWKHVTSKSSKDLTPTNWTNAEHVRRRLEQRVTMTRTKDKSFVSHYRVQRRDRYINEDYT